MKIWKWRLAVADQQKLMIPRGAEILSVQISSRQSRVEGGQPCKIK